MPFDGIEYLGLDVRPDRIVPRVGDRFCVDRSSPRVRIADSGLRTDLRWSDDRGITVAIPGCRARARGRFEARHVLDRHDDPKVEAFVARRSDGGHWQRAAEERRHLLRWPDRR